MQAVEAARTVEDNVIVDPREADVGSILGFGFAPFTGGTLSYIDFMGTKEFVALCHKLEAKYGSRFTPPKLLEDMAKTGETFYQPLRPEEAGGGVTRTRVHLSPLAGRGRSGAQRVRVRGRLAESELAETPPHPDPLPASGARERGADAARHRLNIRTTRPVSSCPRLSRASTSSGPCRAKTWMAGSSPAMTRGEAGTQVRAYAFCNNPSLAIASCTFGRAATRAL